MKSTYWITRAGVVVEARTPFERRLNVFGIRKPHRTAWCRRVATGGAAGYMRIDRLRKATRDEVRSAKAERKARGIR